MFFKAKQMPTLISLFKIRENLFDFNQLQNGKNGWFLEMPLLWHGLAGRVCHNVGIASDIFVGHTFNIMRIKLSILIFVLSLSILNAMGVEAEEKDARSNLISDIKNWVSSTLSIQQNEIKVLALDKRLKIPVCEESYTISFPVNSIYLFFVF